MFEFPLQLSDRDFSFEVAPSILQPISDVSVEVGRVAILKCRVCGRPRPAVSWTGPEQKAVSGRNVTLVYLDDGTAVIEVSAAQLNMDNYCIGHIRACREGGRGANTQGPSDP